MLRLWFQALSLLLLLTHTTTLEALSRADRKEAKAYLSGTLYARIDLPCGSGAHPMGTYMIPLVEVSPEAVNTEGEATFSTGWLHGHGTYWGVGPNDTLQFAEMEKDGDTTIEAEFEGIGKTEGNDTVIKFVGIQSLDDFKKAVDSVFARVPLQDEHDDWPPEVKKAIADRQLMRGMTKRQAFFVTGGPENVRETEEEGKKVEVWTLRHYKGVQFGRRVTSSSVSTGPPKKLRFVDGVLEEFDASATGSGFKLDD